MIRLPSQLLVSPLVLLAALVACNASDNTPVFGDAGTSSGGSGGGGAQGGAGGDVGSVASTSGVGGGFGAGGFMPTPVRELPLLSITFYERTGGTAPTPYTFTINGPELTVREPDPLTFDSADITGAGTEYYDVYYSEEDGSFNIDGSYLTISGAFESPLPAGGGLNLAEIGLDHDDQTTEFGNYLASYVVLGDNSNEDTVERCVDGDLQTHTTMGNTVGQTERLRLTLGFASTSGPPR